LTGDVHLPMPRNADGGPAQNKRGVKLPANKEEGYQMSTAEVVSVLQ